jgi:RHS repeat-associated protein
MDNEVHGSTGAFYDYGFRVYDPRIAKFLSVDPLTKSYPMLTPYQFASNTPIAAIDLDGLEAKVSTSKNTLFITLKNVDFQFVIRKSNEYFTQATKNFTSNRDFTINSQMFDYADAWDYYWAKTPQPTKDYTPQGFNISEGNKVSGRSADQTFYFSQNASGQWTTGFGDVPSDSKFGFGGGTPLIIKGLKFGTTNIYKDDAPERVKKVGTQGWIKEEDWKYLKQKSNGVYPGQSEADVGKTILGYNSIEDTWIIVSQQNGKEGYTLDEIRDKLYDLGYDHVLGMDGSSSATLSEDGNIKVKPSQRKNSTIPSGINLSVPNN